MMFNGMTFGGTVFRTDICMTVPAPDDWSKVRSPARAARRLKRGHPQRIRYGQTQPDPAFYAIGHTVWCHPATLAKAKVQMQKAGVVLI